MRLREAIGEGVASVPVEGPGLKGSWRKVKASWGRIRVPGGAQERIQLKGLLSRRDNPSILEIPMPQNYYQTATVMERSQPELRR